MAAGAWELGSVCQHMVARLINPPFLAYRACKPLTVARGLTNLYGVFETYYINALLISSTPSAISWIGSIQLFLTMVVGIFAG